MSPSSPDDDRTREANFEQLEAGGEDSVFHRPGETDFVESDADSAPLPKSHPKQPTLGDYVLLGKIGAGGMGRVFKAQHRRMERLVALKMLPPAAMRDTQAVKRFRREVKAAAKLFHPNIVTAFDAGEQNGVHYLVMEFVDGHALSQLVRQHGPLAPEKAADYILQAARGLQYAHSRDLVHRDIKPSNLIVDGAGVVKILDMGTARLDDAASANDLTQTGVIMGTVDYMSPEQARASARVDHRTDVYSLGCTFFYLLTAQPLFQGDVIQTLLAHAQEPVPRLLDLRPDIPEWMDAVFRQMVAKSPDDRFATMTDVVEALERQGGGAVGFPGGQAGRLAGLAASATGRAGRRVPAVGIDLGTSYCRVAYVDEQGNPVTLLDADGRPATPAAICLDGLNLSVGQRALKMLNQDRSRVALDIKRSLGARLFPQPLGDTDYPPEVLTALLLAKVTDDARRRIGEFRKVVISVPAFFDEVRRKAVQDAGFLAGLDVVDIINEPMAAMVAHAFEHDFLKPPGKGTEPVKVLVVDVGGGSVDVSIMDDDGDHLVELAADGDLNLGGRDWDDLLVQHVAQQCLERTGKDPREEAAVANRLWLQCEKARRLLSEHEQVTIEFRFGNEVASLPFERRTLESLIRESALRVRAVVQRAVEAARLEWRHIDRVHLVGGAARTPLIARMIKQLAQRRITIGLAEDDAVAHGAALFAAARDVKRGGGHAAFRLSTVNAHSLGVVGIDPRSRDKCNATLIARNTPLPATANRVFKTRPGGQDAIMVQIIQGDHPDPQQCTHIGKCLIEDLPADLPGGSRVTVEFHYGANGRLSVFVESPSTGYRATKEIARARGLSNVELTRWREWIETVMLCSNFT